MTLQQQEHGTRKSMQNEASGKLSVVTQNINQGLRSTLEEMQLDHAINSAITATKLPLCCII